MPNSMFTELKRRNVFKVGVAYLALAWVVLQISDIAIPALHLPEWVNSLVFFLGLIGFPFALFFAWAFEITPEGVKRTEAVDKEQSITLQTGRKIDFAIIAFLSIALGLVVVDSYLLPNEIPSHQLSTKPQNDNITIAVLPLINMSAMAENAYFASGVHEDILTNLSRVKSLDVKSRTSVMPYLSTNKNLRDIASELGAQFIVEGSVRRLRNHVRITIQLIDAVKDTHLWANTYDRELTDIFAIQSKVAKEISNSIHLAIQPSTIGQLNNMPTQSVKAYDLYLKAKSIERSELESESSLRRQFELLEQAVIIDSEFVEAWAMLNEVYDSVLRTINQFGWFATIKTEKDSLYGFYQEKAVFALKKAYSLDPENLETLIALAGGVTGEESITPSTKSVELRKQVNDYLLAKYPESAMGWYVLAWWYFLQGDNENSSISMKKSLSLDPFHARIVEGALIHFRNTGDQAMVSQLFSKLTEIAPEQGDNIDLGQIPTDVKLTNLYFAFMETADQALINDFVSLIRDWTDASELIMEKPTQQSIAWVLTNDMDALLSAYNQEITLEDAKDNYLPEMPNWNNLTFYLLLHNKLMQAQKIVGNIENARTIALRILKAQSYRSFAQNEFSDINHAIVARAYAVLGNHKKAQRWIDKLINERADHYNSYGLFGFSALAETDIEQAITLILEEKSSNPKWTGLDEIAVNHVDYRTIIVHPKIKAYYLSQRKWGEYLSQRVSEYNH